MKRRLLLAVGVVAVVGVALMLIYRSRLAPSYYWRKATALSEREYEHYARACFQREHPGEKPLNWRVGAVAVRFYHTHPMGKFILGIKPGQYGNDCSDFVECVIDQGVGVKARFKRGSREHLVGTRSRYVREVYWDHRSPVQPGDVIAVRHSPWYKPYNGACWHVGIVGDDGMVYDFEKLKSWRKARYGRHTVAWFVHNSTGPDEVTIGRLRPQYRYLLKPLP